MMEGTRKTGPRFVLHLPMQAEPVLPLAKSYSVLEQRLPTLLTVIELFILRYFKAKF